MLQEFIIVHRDEIIRRCRAKVAARSVPPPTPAEIEHGVPVFLDQLVAALRRGLSASPEIGGSALLHGHDLLVQGFTVSQVVNDYGDVCQSITELAMELDAPISADDFRMLNGCLDQAIAGAVSQFGRERQQATMDTDAVRENERLGFFTHELRNLTNTAILALEVIKTGNVGLGGSTGAVLTRSLQRLRALIGRSVAEVRLTQGVQNREPFLVAGFINELAATATLDANARGLQLTVQPVETDLVIDADRDVLAAVMMNLLQNAFKFTRPRTTVTLRVRAGDARVCMEVEDECGGLPEGHAHDLFRPFEQRSTDRTGMGLGLAFSRWAVDANQGTIVTRNLPGQGCVFAIDLPRCHVPALEIGESRSDR